MTRACTERFLLDQRDLRAFGMNAEMIGGAIAYTYKVLDDIDAKLLEDGSLRLSELLELANLSAIIGNLFRGGVVKASGGKFAANSPHTYPDLLGRGAGCRDVEIKVALETNKPKGHLAKPGPHVTIRYVLADAAGVYCRGKENRGKVAWIWEVRAGLLASNHFNCSNTEGDSGKTAVINAAGMTALNLVYCDLERCPLSARGAVYERLKEMMLRR